MQENKGDSSGSVHDLVTGFSKRGNRPSAFTKRQAIPGFLPFKQQVQAVTAKFLVSQTRPICLDSYTMVSQAHKLFANLKCGLRASFKNHFFFSVNLELLRGSSTFLYVLTYPFVRFLNPFLFSYCSLVSAYSQETLSVCTFYINPYKVKL